MTYPADETGDHWWCCGGEVVPAHELVRVRSVRMRLPASSPAQDINETHQHAQSKEGSERRGGRG